MFLLLFSRAGIGIINPGSLSMRGRDLLLTLYLIICFGVPAIVIILIARLVVSIYVGARLVFPRTGRPPGSFVPRASFGSYAVAADNDGCVGFGRSK